ncbi:MAG: hypothetical protein GF331_24540 [Chitinivibrionales bacterium]|nr:hypothetical protein [Chitinivibrionales bacterium]
MQPHQRRQIDYPGYDAAGGVDREQSLADWYAAHWLIGIPIPLKATFDAAARNASPRGIHSLLDIGLAGCKAEARIGDHTRWKQDARFQRPDQERFGLCAFIDIQNPADADS